MSVCPLASEWFFESRSVVTTLGWALKRELTRSQTEKIVT